MAGRLLWVTLMVSGLQSCLLPQDGNVLPVVDALNPPKKNHPPRILQETASPAQAVSISTTPNCQTFSVAVTDPDGDTIFTEWFIDPDETFTTTLKSPIPPIQGGQVATNSGSPGLANSPFGLTAATSQLLVVRPGKQPHILTLVVSDGFFTSPGQPVYEPLPDGGQTCQRTGCSGIVTQPKGVYTDGGILPDGGPVTIVDPSYTDSYTWVVSPDPNTTCP